MIKAINSREFIPGRQIPDQEFRAVIAQDAERRVKFFERKKILRDQLKAIIETQLSLMFSLETFQDMRYYIDASVNLMRRIVREVSILYKDEHDRAVTPQAAQKRYEELIGENTGFGLQKKMRRIQYFTNGLNDILLQIVGTPRTLNLNILTPDQVVVIENPDDPLMLDAVLIEHSVRQENGVMVIRYVVWTPTRHFILDENFRKIAVEGNPEMLNPYWEINMMDESFFPFIGVHNDNREEAFWDQFTGTDLVEATKLIAIKNTFLYFMFPMQFKQLAAQGNFDDKEVIKNQQIKSPLHIMKSNKELNVLDWQSKILELSEAIEKKIFAVASNYGVSPENFKLSADATSGFARLLSMSRVLEIREEQIPIYRKCEEEVFEAARVTVDLYGNGNPIPETAKFSIDYAEPSNVVEDEMTELAVDEKKIEMGLMNPLDLIKRENPDIKTDEQAEEVFQKNIEIRNRLRSRLGLSRPLTTPNQQGA